jgi:serine/threonine protein kinase
MSDAAIDMTCPACGASWTAAASTPAPECPKCGANGDLSHGEGLLDAADSALMSDLREAFALQPQIEPPGSTTRLRHPQPSMLALPPGTRLGDFEIISELGRGGMGVVYRARQLSLNRAVALKILPSYARHGREAVERFQAEAQAAARLHHTNVVAVYAQGEVDGHYFYAMELVDGVGLDTVIRRRPDLLTSVRLRNSSTGLRLTAGSAAPHAPSGAEPEPAAPAPEAAAHDWTAADYRHLASLVAEVADALTCAHAAGVVHRDVKPHNLLLSADNRLHLTDFGLARMLDTPHLTLNGEIMGTPAYLSPEQITGGAPDHRTDIYSLGVTLYELLTRHKPFEGQARDQIMHAIVHAEPLPPRRHEPRIPRDLETICLRAMDKEPARRHASAALLAEDLRRFAAGRPILSRRTSVLERALKWARRHKSRALAAAASLLTLVLVALVAWNAVAARREATRRAVRAAYDQLAYFDYRQAPRVDLEAAERGAADLPEAVLAQALAALGSGRFADAQRALDAPAVAGSADRRPAYLRAWAQQRQGLSAAAHATLAAADARGMPDRPDAWFFRGMALQFDDPQAALECYRRANLLRAQQGDFYPQAVLHMARARNQCMYTTRSITSFEEANRGLQQLVDNGYYGAYPYYLLSIAHRLAAEIYAGSTGTRADLAAEYYATALDWARRGQALDAADDRDRPVTAEAECLESMGQFAAAVAARTRAIELTTVQHKRCENYHYRWRLAYWLGDLQTAGADVQAHAACDEASLQYAHVYPALLAAEAGDLATAFEHARALAGTHPTSPTALLWSATTMRLLGAGDEAERLLAERRPLLDYAGDLVPPQTADWMQALLAYSQTGAGWDELVALADAADRPWRMLAEAHFHRAVRALAEGDRSAARASLHEAYRAFDGEQRYTYDARLLLEKLENGTWPVWLSLSSTVSSAAAAGPGRADSTEGD